jgi:hypothetical protein
MATIAKVYKLIIIIQKMNLSLLAQSRHVRTIQLLNKVKSLSLIFFYTTTTSFNPLVASSNLARPTNIKQKAPLTRWGFLFYYASNRADSLLSSNRAKDLFQKLFISKAGRSCSFLALADVRKLHVACTREPH